jgi:hypothetical protein
VLQREGRRCAHVALAHKQQQLGRCHEGCHPGSVPQAYHDDQHTFAVVVAASSRYCSVACIEWLKNSLQGAHYMQNPEMHFYLFDPAPTL